MLNSSKTYSLDDARKKLEYYCSYQERCHKDVEQKLRDMKMIPEARNIIILHLMENNYLNEERFAKTFARGKFRIKKWGRRRLTLELRKKDISKVNIKLALEEIEEVEYIEVFNELSEKKANSLRENSKLKKKRKLQDYLLYRGWETHLVYDKVNELIK